MSGFRVFFVDYDAPERAPAVRWFDVPGSHVWGGGPDRIAVERRIRDHVNTNYSFGEHSRDPAWWALSK